jgi:hypothetical protein
VVATQTAQNKFKTDVGTVICSVASFTGHQSTETATTLTVHPTYSTCTLAGTAVSINTVSCSYRFNTPVTAPAPTHATVSVLCSAGSSIVIRDATGVGCEVSVGTQNPGGVVSFENSAPSVSVTAAVTGITYTDNGSCPNTETGHTNSTGTYSGGVSASGFTSSSVANEIMVT